MVLDFEVAKTNRNHIVPVKSALVVICGRPVSAENDMSDEDA